MRKEKEQNIKDKKHGSNGNPNIPVANYLSHRISIFQCRQFISKIAQESARASVTVVNGPTCAVCMRP
jgi:hypothetical protein